MKRIILCLTFMALVLLGCEGKDGDTHIEVNNPEQNFDDEIGDASKDTVPVVFHLEDGLPDIGEYSGKEIKTYFNDSVTNDFVPRDDYGEIIPFVGGRKKFLVDEDSVYHHEYNLFGFCTLDGRIVMDVNPEFESLELNETDDGFGYYTVYRATPEDVASYYSSASLVIPKDGSWMISHNNIRSVCADNGVIAVITGSTPETVIYFYDYNGKLINKIEEYAVFLNYAEGLALVGDFDNEYERKYFFINIDGERVIGPFKESYPFNGCGVTYLTDLDGETYLVDKTGKRLTDKNYRNILSSNSNIYTNSPFVALSRDEPNEADIYDAKGNFLFTVTGGYDILYGVDIFFVSDDEIIYSYDNLDTNWKRMSDNSAFCSKEFGVMPNELDYLLMKDGLFCHHNKNTGFCVIFDKDGETVFSCENLYNLFGIDIESGVVIYASGTRGDTRVLHVYDYKNGKELYTGKSKDAQAFFVYENKRYIRIFDGEVHLLDVPTQEMVFENKEQIGVTQRGEKLYFDVASNNVYTLYDSMKNVLIRVNYE